MTITDWSVIAGDCRALMPAQGRFDLILADPPYGDTSLAWDHRVDGWLTLVRAALKPSGSLWVFGSLRCFMATAAQFTDAGLRYAQEIVWEKQNGTGFHADRFKRVHELVAQFYRADVPWSAVYNDVQTTPDATARTVRRKMRPPHTGHIDAGHYVSEDGGPRLMRSVIYARNCHGTAIHPTEKPSGLIEILIRTSCPQGGLVGDWFAGSGAAGEACRLSGRRYVGCEIDAGMAERAGVHRVCAVIHGGSAAMTAGLCAIGPSGEHTLVELTWREKRIEYRIRFGRIAEEQRLDRHRRIVSFAPGSVFGFVRWAANEYGTIISRIDVVRAVGAGEPYQTLPFVRPGGEILLRISGWPKVERVLGAIDAIEVLGIDAADVAPEHWRHLNHRIGVNEPFRIYSIEQHRAWLRRREVSP